MAIKIKQEDLKQNIISSVRVTLQRVTIAKAFILKNFTNETEAVIKKLVSEMECSFSDTVDFSQGDQNGNELKIKQTSESLSWIRAGCEAVWSLISSGLLIPQGNTLINPIPHLQCRVSDNGGSQCDGWDFDSLNIDVPKHILLPLSMLKHNDQILTDPDLFLHSIDIDNIHKKVEISLREAVQCFRNDLFVACLAMLGQASEGAWLELGLGLLSTVPSDSSLKPDKIRNLLESPFTSIRRIIQEVVKLYENKDVFGNIHKQSNFNIHHLRDVSTWADSVRESRNAIHYGVEPSLPNTYEKVAVFLVSSVKHFRVIYRIIEVTEQINAADS